MARVKSEYRNNVSENCIYTCSQMFKDNWNANDKFFKKNLFLAKDSLFVE